MLNVLELQLEKHGNWHIGIVVNNDFLFYTTEELITVPLANYPAEVQLIFTGKKYNVVEHSDNYCKVKHLFLNQLEFPYLIQQAKFNSDNLEYKVIDACDYINLNGVWQIDIHQDTAEQQLRKII